MREVEAEIVCLQEVWMDDHWALVRDALEPRLPHIIRPEAEPGGDLSCSVSELAPVAKCIASQCSGGRESVAECVWRRCRPAMSTASSGCLTCLGSDPRRPLGEVATHCVSAAKSVFGGSRDTAGSPTRMGPDHFYAYGGSRGLALATSLPIVRHEVVPLPSTFTQRAAVHAELETPAGRAHVLCTHLASGVGPFPAPRGQSWDDVHRDEVRKLIELADERARPSAPSGGAPFVLVLGDLNAGPGKPPHISARRLQTYRSLLSAGFSSPYADRGDAGCTLCFDNPLHGHRGTRGILIDHILVRGFGGKLAAFDFMRSPASPSDAGGAPIAYSDHNGVLLVLEP
jgi:endonuclease/exonuclease/phosphatase family metal-dependent hydrolase